MEVRKTTEGLYYKNECMEENIHYIPRYKVVRLTKKLIDICEHDTLLKLIDIIVEDYGIEDNNIQTLQLC